jgi:hypothetical protein
MRDLTGKICEIDYVGSSVRVLGKITEFLVRSPSHGTVLMLV